MIVWRVEHRSSREGPYTRYGEKLYRMGSAHSNPNSHPNTSRDGLCDHFPSDRRHGFDCEEAMLRWFQGYGEALVEEGFMATRYEVPDEFVKVGRSGKQCVFQASAAREVSQHHIDWR